MSHSSGKYLSSKELLTLQWIGERLECPLTPEELFICTHNLAGLKIVRIIGKGLQPGFSLILTEAGETELKKIK